tara:strand:- start:647 stop:799 length:153 start_codon:yes stop_codon:yes gene_type:complete
MIARILNIWRPSYFFDDLRVEEDDIEEMIIWSSNIQDPTHELFNPFLLTQ